MGYCGDIRTHEKTAGGEVKPEVWVIALNKLVLEDQRKWNTKWIIEARYELDMCPLTTTAEYLDIRLQKMVKLN